jgi:hypothetical protein
VLDVVLDVAEVRALEPLLAERALRVLQADVDAFDLAPDRRRVGEPTIGDELRGPGGRLRGPP